VSEASRQRWNHEQIPEMGSLDRPSLGFPQPVCRVRRHRRSPVLDNRNPHWGGAQFFKKTLDHLVIAMRFHWVVLVYLAIRVLTRTHKNFSM
jgi:hypothetical protein